MTFFPGQMIKGGGGCRPSAEITSTSVNDFLFSGDEVYASFISMGTTISSPRGHPTRTPDSSMLCIFLAFLILYLSRVIRYFSNQDSTSVSLCVSTRL